MGWWWRGGGEGPAQLPACLAAPPPCAAITALLLLKYSVLLATISQRVKARRASKKEGKCDNEINPGPAGPGRARQAEHDVLQPPHPRGPAESPEGPRHPKSLWLPSLAELVASPLPTWRASRVLLGALSIPSFSKLLQSRSLAMQWDEELRIPPVLGDVAEEPSVLFTPR